MRAIAAGLCLCLLTGSPAVAELPEKELRELEEHLARLGFDPGPVDGVADAQTVAAIEGYQSFAALRVDGLASAALLEELRGVTQSLGAADEGSPGEPAPTAPDAVTAAADDNGVTRQDEDPAPSVTAGAVSGAPWENAVHLASFRQEDKAEQEWQRLQQRLPSLLGDMDPNIHEIDLAEEGLFYRLYTGPFPNLATAQDFCGILSQEGFNCGIARGESPQMAESGLAISDGTEGTEGQDDQDPPDAEPVVAAVAEEQPAEQAATALIAPSEDPPAAESQVPDSPPALEEASVSETPEVTEAAPVVAPVVAAAVAAAAVATAASQETTALETLETTEVAPSLDETVAAEAVIAKAPAEETPVEKAPAEVTADVTAVSEAPGEQVSVAEAPEAGPEAGPETGAETGLESALSTEDLTEPMDGPAEAVAKAPGDGGVGAPTVLIPATQIAASQPGETGLQALGEAPSASLKHGPTILVAAAQFGGVKDGGSRGSPDAIDRPGEPTDSALAQPEGAESQDAGEEGAAAAPSDTAPAGQSNGEAPQTAALVVTGADDYAAAMAAFKTGDCETALSHYAEAIEKGGLLRRDLSAGYNKRGRCLYDLARYYEALADLNKAIEFDRAFAAAYYNRGRVHNALGNSAQARSDLKAAYDLGFGRLQQQP